MATTAPELIRPALTGIGGWDRLTRFEAAARQRTIAAAANELGIAQSTLVTQIKRIERELGVTLLERNDGARPMRPTEEGARVAATIRACARQGGYQRDSAPGSGGLRISAWSRVAINESC